MLLVWMRRRLYLIPRRLPRARAPRVSTTAVRRGVGPYSLVIHEVLWRPRSTIGQFLRQSPSGAARCRDYPNVKSYASTPGETSSMRFPGAAADSLTNV